MSRSAYSKKKANPNIITMNIQHPDYSFNEKDPNLNVVRQRGLDERMVAEIMQELNRILSQVGYIEIRKKNEPKGCTRTCLCIAPYILPLWLCVLCCTRKKTKECEQYAEKFFEASESYVSQTNPYLKAQYGFSIIVPRSRVPEFQILIEKPNSGQTGMLAQNMQPQMWPQYGNTVQNENKI